MVTFSAMDDIVALIGDEHARIRRLFADLAQAQGQASRREALWRELAALLLAYLDAAEEICYPALFSGAPGERLAVRALHADNGDIRDAAADTLLREAGSPGWWLAVRAARTAADRHIACVESRLLPAFRQRLPGHTRRALGGQWRRFMADVTRDGRRLGGASPC